MKSMDVRNSSEEPGVFWEAYRACAEENRVRPDRSPFYVNWAKDFANFLPEKSLRDRSRKDIETFLANLEGQIQGGVVQSIQISFHVSSCPIAIADVVRTN